MFRSFAASQIASCKGVKAMTDVAGKVCARRRRGPGWLLDEVCRGVRMGLVISCASEQDGRTNLSWSTCGPHNGRRWGNESNQRATTEG